MNTLKRNIIYNYIVTTFVLLAVEIYLYKLLLDYVGALEAKTGIPEIIFMCLGLVIGFVLFGAFSYGYYRKVSSIIAEEAKRQVRQRNMLFANIAHDLKNPISSVLGYARALESDAVSDEEKQVVYRTISAKSLQIDEMIQKMFRYAKMESDGYSLCLKQADLCGVVRECAAMRYSEIESRGIDLAIDIPNEPVMCNIDPSELPRTIDNLISNAVKHNGYGIRLLIALKDDGDCTKIIVADSGCEIPDGMKKAVFEPFQCSDESRMGKDGSGLGLAIAKRIMELHGGKLYIDNSFPNYTKAFIAEFR